MNVTRIQGRWHIGMQSGRIVWSLLVCLCLLVIVVLGFRFSRTRNQSPVPINTMNEQQWFNALANHMTKTESAVNIMLSLMSNYMMTDFRPDMRVQLDAQVSIVNALADQGKSLGAPSQYMSLGREYSDTMDELQQAIKDFPDAVAAKDVRRMAHCTEEMGHYGRSFSAVKAKIYSHFDVPRTR